MLKSYDRVPDVQRVMDRYDWYFVPILNPDGYLNTWVVSNKQFYFDLIKK